MKTAIRQLIDKLDEEIKFITDDDSFGDRMHRAGLREAKSISEKLLELEKQQIIDAVTFGNRMEFYDATEEAGEQYYLQIYKTNEK